MNIAILDDMSSDRIKLKNMILEYMQLKNLGGCISTYETAEKFLSEIKNKSFALAFLDIRLKGMTGMEAAHKIREFDNKLPIVFVTVEKDFAIEGYEVQATGFILKPFDKEKIFRILDKVFENQTHSQYISIKENRVSKKILLDTILFAETRSHYIEIHTFKDVYRSYMTFDEFCALLPEQVRFHCCYRGIIINFDHVKKMDDNNIFFENGDSVPISRSKRGETRNAYAAYAFEKTRREGF